MTEQTSGSPESLDSAAPIVAEGSRHGRRRAASDGADSAASERGVRNPKVLMLALGGVAILGVAGWAFVLPMLTGSSSTTAADARIVHHVRTPRVGLPAQTVKAAAKPVAKPLLIAQDFEGVIGRDPFKPLVVQLPPAAAVAGIGVPTAGTGPAPSSGGGSSGTGGSGSSGPPPQAAPTKVVLLSVYRTSAGVPHARISVNGTVNDVLVDGKFGSFFQLNDIINNYAVIQFGDATQVDLYPNEPRYFQN